MNEPLLPGEIIIKVVSAPLLEAIKKLYFWQYRRTECFSDHLFTLMQKADSKNFERLKLAFPEHAGAYQMWYAYPGDQMDFFCKYMLELAKARNRTP